MSQPLAPGQEPAENLPLAARPLRLKDAIALHRSGRLDEARQIYQQLLIEQPEHAEALHLLGVVALQSGANEDAIDLIDRAIAIKPDVAAFYCNRGNGFQELKQFERAVASYDQAISRDPSYADAFFNRGNALRALRQPQQALASFDQAIAIKPAYAKAHFGRGAALQDAGQLEPALASYDQAILLNLADAEALCNRGVVLERMGKFEAALASHDAALALKPGYAEAWSNRGVALQALDQTEAAIRSYQQAISANPAYAQAHFNLGAVLKNLNRLDESLASYDQAIRLDPGNALACSNRGTVLLELMRFDQALASFDMAIEASDDFAEAYWNKSLLLLSTGQLEAGWALYEWRWKNQKLGLSRRKFQQPLWLGTESLKGKKILLHSEQGFGDTIQFIRYASLLAERGADVIVEVQPALIELLRGLTGVGQWVLKGEPLPEFDYHCPLLSLPLACKTTLQNIPNRPAYIGSDPAKVTEWRHRLGPRSKPRVGLVWSGNSAHKNDSRRSVEIASLLPYLPEQFEYFSLQKDISDADRLTLQGQHRVKQYDASMMDFPSTAALCELMDLVITVDTSLAHMSAALGKPTWIMLHHVPDWRWLLDRSDSPWYPSASLYRQGADRDWAPVFMAIRAELGRLGSGQKLSTAIALHQQGQLDRAKAIYQEILAVEPLHADALHLSGLIEFQQGRFQGAVDLISKAIVVRPDDPVVHCNLGQALQGIGQATEALASYDQAIAVRPDYAEAYCYRGGALKELRRFEAAITSYDRAIAINPAYVDAYYNRGNGLRQMKRLEAAIASYDQAIQLDPGHAGAYSNRGICLTQLKQFDAALASYEAALKIDKNALQARLNQGNALALLDRHEEAIACYDSAIAARPDFAQAHAYRGLALQALLQMDAAIASFDSAISLQPDYADAQWNKAVALLLSGDFKHGWPLYEWRWQNKKLGKKIRFPAEKLWLGGVPIKGKRLLMHTEQGYGDTIQFIRYARLAAELGATVIAEVPAALIPLLEGLEGVSQWVAAGKRPPDYDYHCPMLSLPLAFDTGLETIPSPQRYLPAKSGQLLQWQNKLGPRTKPRVGLVWSGSEGHSNDKNRSIKLASLLEYLPDQFEYFSLQKELRDDDRATLEGGAPIRHFGAELVDFSSTAALCELMDVMLTVDTSIAHLGGALGRPTWIMLPFAPDWRWLLDRTDSPWYASAQLYRQAADRRWAPVLERLRADLLKLLA